MPHHVHASGRACQNGDVGGIEGEIAQHEASSVENGFVGLEILHGEDGEAGYLIDVGGEGASVSVLVFVVCADEKKWE